ncbi:MAG: response regulator transcription factor [bacterium]|nr:response regulator transcription factor [bacterium]
MTKQILVVDDDPHIREVVAFAVEKAGMAVLQAADGRQALDMAAKHKPDLLVLDISMPELDGLEVCRSLRKNSDVPILFLSSRDEEVDRIIGLELGGDDYVTKPFSPRELVARINAILKRRNAPASPADVPQKLSHGKVTIDAASYTAFCNGKSVALTATEFMLLLALFRSPDRVFTRDELMDRAYGDITVSDRTIDSHIRRVRQKFAACHIPEVIVTNHGIGYKLGSCA